MYLDQQFLFSFCSVLFFSTNLSAVSVTNQEFISCESAGHV